MDDLRLGSALRAIRIRRGWRQADVAAVARVSPGTVSLVECGLADKLSVRTLRSVASALEARVDLVVRWRGADVDRLLGARHSAMHERVARWLAGLPGWEYRPEVSFSHYGERGIVDGLAWHAASRSLLVVEMKTEIVDVQALIGSMDRRRRLARDIGRSLGWDPVRVGVCVIVADSRTNRRHVAQHREVFRAAFPHRGHALARWLRDPAVTTAGPGVAKTAAAGSSPAVQTAGPNPAAPAAFAAPPAFAALTYLPYANTSSVRRDLAPVKRVRRRASADRPPAACGIRAEASTPAGRKATIGA